MNIEINTLYKKIKNGELGRERAAVLIKKLRNQYNQNKWINNSESRIDSKNLPPLDKGGEVVFSKKYTNNENLLKDHKLYGEQLLMGLAHCSLVVQALSRFSTKGDIVLKNVTFLDAIRFAPLESIAVDVVLRKKDGALFFENQYIKQATQERISTASGEIVFNDMDSLLDKAISISEWKEQAIQTISCDKFYRNSGEEIYGDSLMSVRQVHILEHAVFSEIKLTPTMKNESKEYVFHPALLDAMHVTASYTIDPDQPWLHHWVPYVIKKLQIHQNDAEEISDELYCHAELVRSNSEIKEFNCKLYSKNGKLIASTGGFYTKRVPSKEALFGIEHQAPLTPEVEKSTLIEPGKNSILANNKSITLQENIQEYLKSKITDVVGTPKRDIKVDVNFMDMGADSKDLGIIAQNLEEETGIKLLPTIFFEYQNIEELGQYFSEEHAELFTAHLGKVALTNKNTPTSKSPNTDSKITPTRKQRSASSPIKRPERLSDTSDDIAIIGMNGRLAESADLNSFWKHIRDSRDLISEIPKSHWDYRSWFDENRDAKNKTYSKWGSFLEDVDKFDPLFFGIPPRQAIWMDPQVRILLEVVHGVFEDAGYCNQIKGSKTGVYTGVCFQEYWDEIVRRGIPMTGYESISSQMSSLSAQISYTFDLQGPSIPLDNACASSLTAMHLACQALRVGDCDQAVVAGMNLLLSPLHYVYSSRIQSLSPTGRCHTFDKRADGYVPGEGIVAVMLKPLSNAIKDQDNIHAVIKGTAINHVGRSNNPTAPRPALQTKMLLDAWEKANVSPETLSYIECHGTGTNLGDPIEIGALTKAFRMHTRKTNFCAIGSTKAHIGHLEGAAGLASVIKVVLSMQHRTIPKMPNFKELNPNIQLDGSPFYINTEVQEWKTTANTPRIAGVSSFGMTGNNAHVVIEEFIPKKQSAPLTDGSVIIVLSAKNVVALRQQAQRLLLVCKEENFSDATLVDAAYTLQVGREAMEVRLALVAESIADLMKKLNGYIDGQKEIEALYQEPTKQNKEPLVEEDEDVEVLLKNRAFRKIAELWVKGASIDWSRLYGENRPRRISLPTYPFAKERYWVPPISEQPSAVRAQPGVGTDSITTEENVVSPKTVLKNIIAPVFEVENSSFSDPLESKAKGISLRVLSGDPIPHQLQPQPSISLAPVGNSELHPGSDEPASHSLSTISTETLVEQLTESLAEVTYMKLADIDVDRSFVDLGLDSIIGVEWIGAINRQYGMSMVATKIYDYPTILEFAGFIARELSAGKTTQPVAQFSSEMASGTQTQYSSIPEVQDFVGTGALNNSPDINAEVVPATHAQSTVSLEALVEQLTTSLADATYMKRTDIDIDRSFVDLGLDSIIGVEWIGAINRQYGTSMAATKIYDYPTIREFAGFINNELGIKSDDSNPVSSKSVSPLSLDELLHNVQQGTLDITEADQFLNQLSIPS